MAAPKTRRVVVLIVTMLLVLGAQSLGGAPRRAGAAAPSTRPAGGHGTALADPDRALGRDWRRSGDLAVTGVGDDAGFHLLVARESTAFSWSILANLRGPVDDGGRWIGNSCVTGSGRYAVAVFAPWSAQNNVSAFARGGFGAVVNLRTGAVRALPGRYTLAYYSPGCGVGDDAVLTRYADDEAATALVTVDAATGRVSAPTSLRGEIASAVPAPDGIYGVRGAAVVRVGRDGTTVPVAAGPGRPFSLVPRVDGGVDLLVVRGDRTVAAALPRGVHTLQALASGPRGRVGLFPQRGGHALLTGPIDPESVASDATVHTVRTSAVAHTASIEGDLIVSGLRQVAATAPDTSRWHLTEQPAAGSQRQSTFTVDDAAGATPTAPTDPRTAASKRAPKTAPKTAAPTCAVPRNDPTRQALQPSANRVEWAVDQAVHGGLTVSRPADYLATHLGAYQPQGLFPSHALHGGGTVPAQVELAILAQESNLRQASFHARPGDGGNPTIADYYGNLLFNPDGSSTIDWQHYDYAAADCGYGIAQVTDHMRAADPTWSATQKVAVATDYATNIAAGLQILQDKWNQLADLGVTANGGAAQYVENWYFAAWAYNSGVNPSASTGNTTGCAPGPSCTDSGGNWGLGYTNNPANNAYPPDRDGFLDDSYADASTPQKWPYQEKVMGWAQHPQLTYGPPAYSIPFYPPNHDRLSLPGKPYNQFCSTNPTTGNHCDPSTGTSYPYFTGCTMTTGALAFHCWWHVPSTWTSCATTCGTEARTYAVGVDEPPLQRQYTPDCTSSLPAGTKVVDDLADTSRNVVGCPAQTTAGTLRLQLGTDPSSGAPTGDMDLHQIGGAYGGHFFFTHTYRTDDDAVGHQVLGTWTAPSTGWSRIEVHVPDHGGRTEQADYHINLGNGQTRHRVVNQYWSKNSWVDIGVFNLAAGANVTLSNITADGDAFYGGSGNASIAYDAIAFVPTTQPTAHYVALGDSYSAGEGLDPYEPDTDTGDTGNKDLCHRSSQGYPYWVASPGDTQTIAAEAAANRSDFHDLACSGAVTTSLTGLSVDRGNTWNAPWDAVDHHGGELLQVDDSGYLDADTTLVTLTIGGNDARFSDVVKGCSTKDCLASNYYLTHNNRVDPEPLTSYEPKIINALQAHLEDVYLAIHAHAPNARIVVAGYPRAFSLTHDGCDLLAKAEVDWLNQLGLQLDSTISNAVAAVKATGADIVFANPDSEFTDHRACDGDNAWINPVDVLNFGSTYHPSAEGQQAYGLVVSSAL